MHGNLARCMSLQSIPLMQLMSIISEAVELYNLTAYFGLLSFSMLSCQ